MCAPRLLDGVDGPAQAKGKTEKKAATTTTTTTTTTQTIGAAGKKKEFTMCSLLSAENATFSLPR